MAQELAFAAPRAEEMTRTVVGIGGGLAAGVAEGASVLFAKALGPTLESIASIGLLLGVPVAGIAGALFTRGMISDACQGVAAGGTAILGFSLPAMLAPEIFARKAPAQLGGGSGVKMLGQGPANAAMAAARAVKAGVGIEF
ncbi:unnamed protein product [marine sediment metagenome]|uniref:Uncharacterized protein n=1 Tax=marine sediment metagenome TaxID=412755 RepID=X1S7J3_9ZZZZ